MRENHMKEQVIELKAKMADLADAENQMREERERFAETWAGSIADIAAMRKDLDECKEALRPLAMAEFKDSGVKQLFGGSGIKESKEKTRYLYDTDKALAFAKEKDMFLILDTKAFEAAAPGLNAPFIRTENVPSIVSVTFPKEIKIDG